MFRVFTSVLLVLSLAACGGDEKKTDNGPDVVNGGSQLVTTIRISSKTYSMYGDLNWTTTTTKSGHLPFFVLGPGQTCESIMCEQKRVDRQLYGQAPTAKLPDGRYMVMSFTNERNENWALTFADDFERSIKSGYGNSSCLIEKITIKSGQFKQFDPDNDGYETSSFDRPFVFIVDDLTEKSFFNALDIMDSKSRNKVRDIELISMCTDGTKFAKNSEKLNLVNLPDWMNNDGLSLRVNGINKTLNRESFSQSQYAAP